MECRVLKNGQCEMTQGYHAGHLANDIVGQGFTIDDVLAHSRGKVVFCQTGQVNNPGSSGNLSYGNCVKIQHDNGYCTLYAHLETVNVSLGQTVEQGQFIGRMGNTGNSYGAHLHIEVRTPDNQFLNPQDYLNADLPGLEKKIKYCGHVQNVGWQDWKHDGETCGTTGESLRMEAIKIDAPFEVKAKAHIQDIGWEDYGVINKDTIIGTTGESKRLECLCLEGNFKYRVHIQDTGWTPWTNADGIATLGTTGQALRMEAIEMVRL